jgi:two-component system, cell cycle sensor histidine kinase and response regulator CckA
MDYVFQAGSPNRMAGDQATILVVEDERIMLRLLGKFLSGQGYRVLAADNGEQAIESYCRHKMEIDLVLLDLDLPKVKGVDVFHKMKSENPDARVVVTSGYIEPRMKAEMLRAGVKHFVTKPYRLPDMIETLRIVTER